MSWLTLRVQQIQGFHETAHVATEFFDFYYDRDVEKPRALSRMWEKFSEPGESGAKNCVVSGFLNVDRSDGLRHKHEQHILSSWRGFSAGFRLADRGYGCQGCACFQRRFLASSQPALRSGERACCVAELERVALSDHGGSAWRRWCACASPVTGAYQSR
jgi:hypothetical protein